VSPADAPLTLVGDPDAEAVVSAHLSRIADVVAKELSSELEALLLVGGYARGEGSMVQRDGRWAPYNDYDLVAVVRDRVALRRVRGPLAAVAHRLTAEVGVEVDLWPTPRQTVRHAPRTLFWLDASRAARVVAGDPSVKDDIPVREVRDLPLAEAGRLLANRAVGLALSNLEAHDRDLRRLRHAHKAVLACGDALLLAADRYPGSVADRALCLRDLATAPGVSRELVQWYEQAVSFRRRPDLSATEDAPLDWYEQRRETVGRWHLSFEAGRIGTPSDAAGYATHPGRIYANAEDLRAAGPAALLARLRGAAPLWPWAGHPRERLARAAVALAYGHDRDDCRAVAGRLIDADAGSDTALHERLSALAAQAG